MRRFAHAAREHDVQRVEAIITAPGRGPGGAELAAAVSNATGWPARVLSADDEGRLAYDGAVARADDLPEVVGVVDVGGGSSEIVVGHAAARRRLGAFAHDRLVAPDAALPAHRSADGCRVAQAPATPFARRWSASSRRDPTRRWPPAAAPERWRR